MWQTEFWNRSVGEIYRLGPPEPAALPESNATFDPATGRISTPPVGGAAPIRYVVTPSTVQLEGRLLEQAGRLSLYRIDGQVRLTTLLGGVYGDGWMGSFAALTQYARPARPGLASVRVSRAGWGGPSPPGKVTINVGPLTTSGGAPAISRVTATQVVDGAKQSRRGGSCFRRRLSVPSRDHDRTDLLPVRLRISGSARARRPGGRSSSRLRELMAEEQLRRQLDEVHRQMVDRDNAYRFHEDEVRRRDHEIEQLSIQNEQLREELAKLQAWAAELEGSIHEMEATRAWRLAVRLRSLSSFPRRLLGRGARP